MKLRIHVLQCYPLILKQLGRLRLVESRRNCVKIFGEEVKFWKSMGFVDFFSTSSSFVMVDSFCTAVEGQMRQWQLFHSHNMYKAFRLCEFFELLKHFDEENSCFMITNFIIIHNSIYMIIWDRMYFRRLSLIVALWSQSSQLCLTP